MSNFELKKPISTSGLKDNIAHKDEEISILICAPDNKPAFSTLEVVQDARIYFQNTCLNPIFL